VVVGFAVNLGVTVNLAPIVNWISGEQIFGSLRLPPDYKPAIVYAAVILLLLLRPSGLVRRELG
jgi:branched-subunit amino acid ABC-type transport system permease component